MSTLASSQPFTIESPQGKESARYPIDARLDEFVESIVAGCRERAETLDETTDTVAAFVRAIAPASAPDDDPDWESHWRSYFAFSDHALMHAIRAYVESAAATSPARLEQWPR